MAASVSSIPLKANVSLADEERALPLPLGEGRGEGARQGRASHNGHAAPQIDFVIGPENDLAAVAFRALLDEEQPLYNPLVVYGPSGAGKTHLARGLAAHFVASRRTVYTSAIDFANQLADAIDGGTTPQFRARFRTADLLVIDDLTQLTTRKVAQQELIPTLDEVIDRGGQAVIMSRQPPERVSALPAALRSRLSAGLALPLLPPGAEARLELLTRFAAIRGLEIPEAARKALAEGLNVSAPELLGALAELELESRMSGQLIDLPAVRRLLAARQMQLKPSVRTIASSSARYFGLRMSELKSPSRRRAVVQARGIAVYLARQLTGKSLEQLGTFFGGRDHTTVLHSVRSIEARLRSDPTTRRAVSDIRKLVAHG